MAILKNCELWYCKLDPARPSAKLNKKNPTWEIQMRTKNREQKEEWAKHGIKVRAVRDDEEGPVLYWCCNLRKKSIKADGEKAEPPKVINGAMEDIDPKSIGNGSIGNIRIFQYDYNDDESGASGKASVLMGIQVKKHILYTPPERNDDDDFGEDEYTVISEDSQEDKEEETVDEGVKKTPSPTLPKVNPEDEF